MFIRGIIVKISIIIYVYASAVVIYINATTVIYLLSLYIRYDGARYNQN